MPVAFQCRNCKGPALPRAPGHLRDKRLTRQLRRAGVKTSDDLLTFDAGVCPFCGGPYRYDRTFVGDDEIDGAEMATARDEELVSAHDLAALAAARPKERRVATGMAGLDYVFDGGLPEFGAIYLFGERGAGKTTLLVEILRATARKNVESLYISAEQGVAQFGELLRRMGRMPAKRFHFVALADHDSILETIETSRARIIAVDSVHAIEGVTDNSGYDKVTGSTAAVSQTARDIKRLADKARVLVFVVGHVTNDGTLAGGTQAQHMLDANLVLRRLRGRKRWLGWDGKTRFGPDDRRALFEMADDGMKDLGPLKLNDDENDDTEATV